MTRRWTRREKRMAWTLGGALAFLLLAVGALWLRQPRAEKYVPGQETEGISDALARDRPADAPPVRFSDVTADAGIDVRHFDGVRSTQLPEDMGSGVAWGDYDGDDWPDLYVVNTTGPLGMDPAALAASAATNRLYRNRGDGTFEDVTEGAGVGLRGIGMGASWADFDEDGDQDLFTTSYGLNHLFRNDGDGLFTDVSDLAGVGGREGFWSGAAWADYDRDGDLDLYVTGYVLYEYDPADLARSSEQYGSMTPATLNPSSYRPQPNLLYRNRGDGTFEEVADEAGVANAAGRSLSSIWTDFNEDGWPDLYVANDVSDNALYLNLGDGVFRDVSHDSWVADYRGAMGLATGDWDNDQDLDLFVTHWIAQENALYNNLLRDTADTGGATEAAAAGDSASAGWSPPRFRDEADRFGLGQIALDYVGWGTGFFDYDNDGRQDLFVVNGSTLQQPEDSQRLVAMRPLLFWNQGAAGFFEVGEASGEVWSEARVGRGAALADYDRDGDVDLFIVNHGAPPQLLRNDGGNAANWLIVRLQGTAPRNAVGARVTVAAGDHRQTREVQAGGSYLSQHALEVHFGLGEAAEVDSLEVRWPDGSVETHAGIAANQLILLAQGAAWRSMPGLPARSADAPSRAAAAPAARATLTREQLRRFWEVHREAKRVMKAEGDWHAAADLFRQALALDPDHGDSLYFLGNALIELEEFPDALAQFEHLVAVNPQSLRGWLQIGAIRASPDAGALFDLALAEAALRRAIAVNPEESGGLTRLGAVQLARGELEAAAESFAHVRRLNPQVVEPFYLAGYIAWRQGNDQAAADMLRSAVALGIPPTPVQGVAGEGDTKRADRGALVAEIMTLRPLFFAQLEALKGQPPDLASSPAAVAAEFEALAAYLAALER